MIAGISSYLLPFSIALTSMDRFQFSEQNIPMDVHSGEHLSVALEDMLQLHGQTLSSLQAIGVITGPGNYTGLRLGVSIAKTIAQLAGVSVYGYSALMHVVEMMTDSDGMYVSVFPSRQGEYHVQLVARDSDKVKECSTSFTLTGPQLRQQCARFQSLITLVGDSQGLDISDLEHVRYVPYQITAASVASRACADMEKGRPSSGLALAPMYSHSVV